MGKELEEWFAANKILLETAYLKGQTPWQQSGVGLHHKRTFEEWETLRKPIADCIVTPGSFLDIGCANGYFLECLLKWVAERDIAIEPYGLDISENLANLAKERLPDYAQNIFVGNAWDWTPPHTFDYVRTELVYIPEQLQAGYVRRLLDNFIKIGGCLLAAEYRSSRDPISSLSIDKQLQGLGYQIQEIKSGFLEGKELLRVAVIKK